MTVNTIVSQSAWGVYRKRKIGEVWRALPMREKGEDWEKQVSSVVLELRGLERLEVLNDQVRMLEILSKLSGLIEEEEFMVFRKTIFDIITLLEELS